MSPRQSLQFNIAASEGNQSEQHADEEDSTIVDGVAYLSLCASGTTDATPEPFYMGSSSGATIARLIQSAIFNGRKPSGTQARRETLRSESVSSFGSSIPTPSFASKPYPYPQPVQAQRLFTVFFNRMHTKWPILNRALYEKVYERQYDQASLSIIERCTLHLIYAISARFLQLTKQQGVDVDPEAHFIAAIENMDYILERHNTSTVQFLTLLAVYGQRSPYGAGVWSQIRYAMTLCVELGMHRKPTVNSPQRDPQDLELRKRIFWSCYCLDRLTSMLLGRTFAISDHDINVEVSLMWYMSDEHTDIPSYLAATLASGISLRHIHPRIMGLVRITLSPSFTTSNFASYSPRSNARSSVWTLTRVCKLRTTEFGKTPRLRQFAGSLMAGCKASQKRLLQPRTKRDGCMRQNLVLTRILATTSRCSTTKQSFRFTPTSYLHYP